jgi:hypothetical protein
MPSYCSCETETGGRADGKKTGGRQGGSSLLKHGRREATGSETRGSEELCNPNAQYQMPSMLLRGDGRTGKVLYLGSVLSRFGF